MRENKKPVLYSFGAPNGSVKSTFIEKLYKIDIDMPEAIHLVDRARIYNNLSEKPLLILEKTSDKEINIYTQPSPSIWDKNKLGELLNDMKKFESMKK